ncbi:KIF14 protein, partial [Amia calva]|nr:KIF14 protein [Amia calva]
MPAYQYCCTLANFRIEKKIGRGQFSEVYRATYLFDGKQVALKKVQIFEMMDAKARQDCIKEIDLLKQLNHPNVIKYLDSFIEENELNIVLELADAGDLSQMIKKTWLYLILGSFLELLHYLGRYTKKIQKVLQHMQQERFVRKDVKETNNYTKIAVIIKLYKIQVTDCFYCDLLTHSILLLVGTPYYMSPERIHENGYNFKSDIWSLGCLLYEMAALQSPFYGDKMNLLSLCHKIEQCDYPPLPPDHYSEKVTCHLEMSYFEVYNEKIHDLLSSDKEPSQKKTSLRVREHPELGPYVAGLSSYVVGSFADVQAWLELGNKQRATAATGMNDKSSRSHSVFTVVLTQTKREEVEGVSHDHTVRSHINLVDLAGSERSTAAHTTGIRLKEGASINKSLMTLGKVICALSEASQSKKKAFIPYRDSVLTWLLKESLGGNSKTAMIAAVSPAAVNIEETLSTLRYATQARRIINVAKVNEDSSARIIRELKAEIEKLRTAGRCSQGMGAMEYDANLQEILSLKEKLLQQERELTQAQEEWKVKLALAEQCKMEEAEGLQKAGVSFKVDNRFPYLVNLNEDPQLSEMLLYIIKEGQMKVGRLTAGSKYDIQLTGALIAEQHCLLTNTNGNVTLTPVEDAKTYINGVHLTQPVTLHHGDRVVLGGDHYFRFNHSVEQSGYRASEAPGGTKDVHRDFEFAKNELLDAQKQR